MKTTKSIRRPTQKSVTPLNEKVRGRSRRAEDCCSSALAQTLGGSGGFNSLPAVSQSLGGLRVSGKTASSSSSVFKLDGADAIVNSSADTPLKIYVDPKYIKLRTCSVKCWHFDHSPKNDSSNYESWFCICNKTGKWQCYIILKQQDERASLASSPDRIFFGSPLHTCAICGAKIYGWKQEPSGGFPNHESTLLGNLKRHSSAKCKL